MEARIFKIRNENFMVDEHNLKEALKERYGKGLGEWEVKALYSEPAEPIKYREVERIENLGSIDGLNEIFSKINEIIEVLNEG